MKKYGYARVSTNKQQHDSQIEYIYREGVLNEDIITDVVSGSVPWKDRPNLRRLVRRMQHEDMLIVAKLDRLGRNAIDVLNLIDYLNKRQISVRILNLGIDTSGAGGKLFLHLLAGFAEFERNVIRERVIAGLDAARSRGKQLGRRKKLSDTDLLHAQRMNEQGMSAREIGDILNVSRMTAWRATKAISPVTQ